MNVFILIFFVSVVLVLGAVVQFAFIVRNRDINFTDQMAIMPLEEESSDHYE